MTSEVEICNLALSNIRAGSINSLDESSIQAQTCKLKYPILRDMVLEDAPWQFAHKVKALALIDGLDLFNWRFGYQYPADCLHINRVLRNFETVSTSEPISGLSTRLFDPDLPIPDLTPQVEYEVQIDDSGASDNRVVATNETDARIDYRAKITDPNIFSTQFVMSLSHLLSAEIVFVVAGISQLTMTKQTAELQIYQAFLASATANDLNEQFHPTPDSDFISVRR